MCLVPLLASCGMVEDRLRDTEVDSVDCSDIAACQSRRRYQGLLLTMTMRLHRSLAGRWRCSCLACVPCWILVPQEAVHFDVCFTSSPDRDDAAGKIQLGFVLIRSHGVPAAKRGGCAVG